MTPQDVVLLAEDNSNDAALVALAFSRMSPGYSLVRVADGQQAIDYLMGIGAYRDRNEFPLPRMILLDLQMPNVDGFQFLEWFRKEPAIGNIPVVVLASSHHSPDIKRAYDMGADSFLTKPVDPEELLKQLKVAVGYWAPIGQPRRESNRGRPAR